MSLQNIPGFGPILGSIFQPLPQFLVTYFVKSAPVLILSCATLMAWNDFFQASGPGQMPSLILGKKDSTETYDFIVVGGGSSGAVIAQRLSQNYRVLLLEGGGDPHPLSYVPAFGSSLYNTPQVDWEYKSQPLNGSGFGTTNGGSLKYPRPRALGGSTNWGDSIYMRGNSHDYHVWAATTGDLKWSYEYLQKYFKKIEDYHGHWESESEGDHGTGGPIHIEKAGFSPGIKHWLDAGSELGLKSNSDPNDKQSESVFQLDVMAKKGVRYGTYRGYLEPEMRRQSRRGRWRWGRRRNSDNNLVIKRYSIVTQIHIERNDEEVGPDGQIKPDGKKTRNGGEKRAVGVTYYRHAIKQYARADKEIILAAGAINTPKLLLLSGIGPLKELEQVGIDQVAELPVGMNLQDHVSTIVGPFLLNSSESFLATRDLTVKSAADYLAQGSGPFSMPSFISGGGLVSTLSASPHWPNIMLTLLGAGTDHILARELVESYSLNANDISGFLNKNHKRDSNYVVVTLGKPKSRGKVTIGSFDPWHHPRIDLNYYSDEGSQDMRDMIEAVQMVVSMYEKTNAYQKLGAHLAPDPYPGCEQYEMKSEPYYECLIRTVTITSSNPCCTAPMGIKGSPQAVVDPELKVIGISGLRIADQSIMPEIVNTQITAASIVIGEVASDLIINDWTTGRGQRG